MKLKDQIGREVKLGNKPKRIVSLVPSITYTLASFEMENEVKGISLFCKYPSHWKKEKTIIGGPKNIKIDRIKKLNPDLILASKEENNKKDIELLSQYFPVYVSDVKDYKSNLDFLDDMGTLLKKDEMANLFIHNIKNLHQKIQKLNNKRKSAVYLIWKDPYMSVGGDTFINEMMKEAGFDNVYSNTNRYPTITIKDIKEKNPEILLLSSEPYPFKQNHKDEWEKILPDTKVKLVKGELFTWFGTYPLIAYKYFINLSKNR
jgi:ABC-type Fe3+-hydroxamate transport system substrate-binding protein